MANETFPDAKPWPAEAGPPRDHNRPPLEEQIGLDFDDAIRNRGLDNRIAEITASADRAPEIDTAEKAGQAGDLISLARAASEQVEAEREILNRPLLTAQRALKAKADSFLAPMDAAVAALRSRLDDFMADHDDAIRGDLGARVGTKTDWRFEITDLAKLPLTIRRHPNVIEAIEKVVRAEIRGGARKIAGVKIWSETKANVR